MPFFTLAWYVPIFEGLLRGCTAMALHEVSHIFVALALGIKVKKIGLEWKGIYNVREAGPPIKNLLVTLAGPLMNLALVLSWPWFPKFALANLVFAVVNLLPIAGSDGERAMRCWWEVRKKYLMV